LRFNPTEFKGLRFGAGPLIFRQKLSATTKARLGDGLG
jgi:hypothetical protein